MGEGQVQPDLSGDELRLFTKRLLTDLRALESMLSGGMIETEVRRIGAEQEFFLVGDGWRPACLAMEILAELDDPHFTTELGKFNLEVNLDPQVFGDDCLSRMEARLNELLAKAREAAARHDAHVVLTGILPTLRKSDLELENMTPIPRYKALNRALSRLRDGAYEFRIKGLDEIMVQHDSVMLEACNTSFQVHFQVGAEEFANLYNISQTVAAPVLAVASNSPLLFGRRLWSETRIALFQQAVDTRSATHHLRERPARVSFGRRWVEKSVTELYQEDISRFKILMGTEKEEDPFAKLEEGVAPELYALRMHNGTVYRWNRACYGLTDGKPHLRIENRIFPSGPTPVDEVANAAFWFGLIRGLSQRYENITRIMEFEDAASNFTRAGRSGLNAEITWLEGRTAPACELIRDELLPLAREGLAGGGIVAADIERYLGVIEERVDSRMTGARWLLNSLAAMKNRGTEGERLSALTAAMINRQRDAAPVAGWSLASIEEAGGWKLHYMKVEQFMTTDLITVHEDEPVDLVANLMDWEKIRHVPVEDHQSHLVGLVSYRALIHVMASGMSEAKSEPLPVSKIMKQNPITVSPETPTLEAISIMRNRRIGCLPVVKDGRLVGMVTERDFMNIASELLEQKLDE